MDTERTAIRREVTRALCWLPPRAANWQRDEETQGGYSLIREARRLTGRIGYLVITETYPVPSLPPERP
jgi:hypothetical protein